jgi:hypothetical protein
MRKQKPRVLSAAALAILMATSPSALLFSQAARAATAGPVGINTIPAYTNGVQNQAGDYNYTTLDKGRLQEKLLSIFQQNQKDDRDYVLMSAGKVEQAFVDLIGTQINGSEGLQTMADNSHADKDQIPTYATYLKAKRAYMTAVADLGAKITSISALPSAMGHDEKITADGSGIVEVRGVGKVDLSEVLNFYKKQLADLDVKVRALNFTIIMPNGVPKMNVTGDIKLPSPYKQTEIDAMMTEIAKLKMLTTDQKNLVKQHNLKTREIIDAVIEAYGDTQRYRLNLAKDEVQKRFTDLEELMWSRSYLRAMYGAPLGALAVDYDESNFNLDFVFAKNNVKFSSEFITNQGELIKSQKKIISALVTHEKRAASILAPETDVLSRVMSTISFLNGTAQLSAVNATILKLLYADMSEELMLAQKGMNAVRANYRSRWYKSEEDKAAVKERADIWSGEGDKADFGGINADSDQGTFRLATVGLKKYLTQLDLAQQKQAVVDDYNSDSETMKKLKKLRDDL